MLSENVNEKREMWNTHMSNYFFKTVLNSSYSSYNPNLRGRFRLKPLPNRDAHENPKIINNFFISYLSRAP